MPIEIRSSLVLSRCSTVATEKSTDQAAVWLFCAVSSQHLSQGIGILSAVLSESLQVRSSQADCISFCSGYCSVNLNEPQLSLYS